MFSSVRQFIPPKVAHSLFSESNDLFVLNLYLLMVNSDGGTVNNQTTILTVHSFLEEQIISEADTAYIIYYYLVNNDGGTVNHISITQTIFNFLIA